MDTNSNKYRLKNDKKLDNTMVVCMIANPLFIGDVIINVISLRHKQTVLQQNLDLKISLNFRNGLQDVVQMRKLMTINFITSDRIFSPSKRYYCIE